jgi:hypothetical protein
MMYKWWDDGYILNNNRLDFMNQENDNKDWKISK